MPRVILASVLLAIGSTIAAHARQSQDVPLPAGAKPFPRDRHFDRSAPPWVFAADGTTTRPLPLLKSAGQSMAIALDDGTTGKVRVERHPCAKEEIDCSFSGDRFEMVISDATGKVIARRTFSSGYGDFAPTPVDLAGGPGDELVIVTRFRGSPPPGRFMDIWQVRSETFHSLLHDLQIEGSVATYPIDWVRWRYDVIVGSTTPKPRPLRLKGRVGYEGPCSTDAEGAAELRAVLRGQTLRLSGGAYRVAAPRQPVSR